MHFTVAGRQAQRTHAARPQATLQSIDGRDPLASRSDLLGLPEDREAVDAHQADGEDPERPPRVRTTDVQ